ncbi:hypothetical protein QL285_017071 [Trifolium repens]|jgi:hypothetical protein|nr:hypothetical protein QL285_017071 [Trifolium repens]
MQTSLWWDTWIGDISLKDRYPRLFLISNQKSASVAEMWNNEACTGRWLFNWRRRFFVWEEVLFEELKEVINGAAISVAADRWCWRPENDAEFTVKSAYSLVFNLSNLVVLEPQWYGRLFSALWKIPTPSKVVGFV